MALTLHPDEFPVKCHVNPAELYDLSGLVARLTGVEPAVNKAVIGRNVFRTEAGVHQDGVLKDPSVYLPFLPERIGAPPVQLVLGKHSGRRAVAHRAAEVGVHLDDKQVASVLDHLKAGPKRRSYESAADIRALLAEVFPNGLHGSAETDGLAKSHRGSEVAIGHPSTESSPPVGPANQ
jgi:isopropylmalate/homocitrate/citramalate synthase